MPMADFQKAIEKVLQNEGGFTDGKTGASRFDKGGATNFGITIGTLSTWLKRQATLADVRSLTKDEAIKIYKAFFWDKMNLDSLEQSIAEALFDQGVNFGISSAIKRAQRVVNAINKSSLKEDGTMGPKTLAEILKISPRRFLISFIADSQDHYINICMHDLSQITFLRGWINRTQQLMELLV